MIISDMKEQLIFPRPTSSVPPLFPSYGSASSCSSTSTVNGRSAALKVHSQAEKRRRERINAHLSTLSRMVPDATKMDKAALLGKVLDHVKELKRKAVDVDSEALSVPTEVNEVRVDTIIRSTEAKSFYIKAFICCEDCPDLYTKLARAFHGLRLRTVRADITSLGGRVQNVFLLSGEDGDACFTSIKESLKEALARITSVDAVSMEVANLSKRQRLLESYYNSVSV